MKENTFKVELKDGEKIVFNSNESTITEISEKIKTFFNNKKDLFLSSILRGVEENELSACWCGTQNFGYKIAKNTEDDQYINYIFQ